MLIYDENRISDEYLVNLMSGWMVDKVVIRKIVWYIFFLNTYI